MKLLEKQLVKMTRIFRNYSLVFFTGFLTLLSCSQVLASDGARGYLNYQEPQITTISWFSNVAYIFSMLITFAAVIGLAYLTSRFLGKKMGQFSSNSDNRVLAVLPLGNNRAVYIVDIVGKVLVLGVSDQSIALLEEITDEDRVEKLRQNSVRETQLNGSFGDLFQKQLASLQHMSNKFPTVFNNRDYTIRDNESEKR